MLYKIYIRYEADNYNKEDIYEFDTDDSLWNCRAGNTDYEKLFNFAQYTAEYHSKLYDMKNLKSATCYLEKRNDYKTKWNYDTYRNLKVN